MTHLDNVHSGFAAAPWRSVPGTTGVGGGEDAPGRRHPPRGAPPPVPYAFRRSLTLKVGARTHRLGRAA